MHPSLTERARRVRFAYRLDAERRLSAPELTSLAEQMTKAENPAEAALLCAEIMRGFYGGAHA